MTSTTDQVFAEVADLLDEDLEFLTDLRYCDTNELPGNSKPKNQAIKRLYIRMLVSSIEGAIATFKQQALMYPDALSEGEKAMLREVTYDISDRGKVITKQTHAPFLSSFRFSLLMLGKAWGLSSSPDYSTEGWQALQYTVRTRNRLTHPKEISEMHVSESDMQQADIAELWFRQTHNAILKERHEMLELQLAQLKTRNSKTGPEAGLP